MISTTAMTTAQMLILKKYRATLGIAVIGTTSAVMSLYFYNLDYSLLTDYICEGGALCQSVPHPSFIPYIIPNILFVAGIFLVGSAGIAFFFLWKKRDI